MAGIFKLTAGGLMVNYRCAARCGHCLYLCSPQRETEYIAPDLAEAVFRRVKALGTPSMHISGGEPFLDEEALCAVLRAAQQAEMPIDYVETSSSFVTTPEAALRTVRRVRALGVRTLSLSISPYHNEFVALDKVLTLVGACREADVTASFWIDEFFPDLTALPTGVPHRRQEYEALFGRGYWAQLRPRHGLRMLGRALFTHEKDMPTVPAARIPHMSRPCAELGGRSHYHIDLYGRYIPLGCPGLSLPLTALGQELDPRVYPVYTRLAQDPRSLLEYCKARGFAPRGSYYNRCHLCQEMRLFLYETEPGAYPELQPASFYEALLAERGAVSG